MKDEPSKSYLEILRQAIRDAVRQSTVRRLFIGWLGLLLLRRTEVYGPDVFVQYSVGYATFLLIYLLTIILPAIFRSRRLLPALLLSIFDWIGRTLVYRWTRYVGACIALLVVIGVNPTPRSFFMGGLIAVLLLPERLHEEQRWRVEPDCESVEDHPPICMADGNEQTHWSSVSHQQQGMAIELYFERPRFVDRLVVYYGKYISDSPLAYELCALTPSRNREPLRTELREIRSAQEHIAHELRFLYTHASGLRLSIAEPRSEQRWSITDVKPHFNWRNRHDMALALALLVAVLGFLLYIFYLGPATQHSEQVTVGPLVHGSPAFSPDGRSIVYDSDQPRESHNRLYLIDTLSGAQIPIAGLGEGRHWHATFSPDGRRLAVSSTRADPKRVLNSHIYVLDLETGELAQLTFGDDRRADWPDFSPDGNLIAFSSLDDTGHHQIFVMDSTEGERLYREQVTLLDGDAIHPRFSPDGNSMVFAGRTSTNPNWVLYMLGKQKGTWSAPSIIFASTQDAFHPDFAPDGSKVIFTMREWSLYTLYILDLNSRSIGWITYLWASDGTFSNDGRFIVFSSALQGNWQIFIMPTPNRLAPPFVTDSIAKRLTAWWVEISSRAAGQSVFRPDPLLGY
jgi:Tol biopolymer transport system component